MNLQILLLLIVGLSVGCQARQRKQLHARDFTERNITAQSRTTANPASCSVESLEGCLKVIKSVTDSEQLAFASTQRDLDKACRKLKHGLNCADDHMKRCATRSQRQVFEDVVKGTRNVISKLCISGPDQRYFLRFSGCYKNVSKSEDKCVIWTKKIQELDVDIQENISRNKIDEGLRKFCCTFIQAYDCQVNHMRRDCGPQAVDFFEKYLNEMSDSLIHRHCSSYGHGECHAEPTVSHATNAADIVLVDLLSFITLMFITLILSNIVL